MVFSKKERVVVVVQGTVQGVGFRPFVYRLALELGLTGGVINTGSGVEIQLEGPRESIDRFLTRLPQELPPLARLDRISVERNHPVTGRRNFTIGVSSGAGSSRASIPPDVATCPDCVDELFDPSDRRYRYPFINCTNCGPRYTISLGHPYDRPLTTMKGFDLCSNCRTEYEDPSDRRFHAQPNACPECGPWLWLADADGHAVPGDPLELAREALLRGKIVALKGLGGFHLAVNALDHAAVVRLRRRKRREEKPLAMMASDLRAVRRFARLTPAEAEVLRSPVCPIVLLQKKEDSGLSPAVSDGVPTVGFMLPYTPIHHLLLHNLHHPLVMTSGNLSEEPMAVDNQEALRHLAQIADLFLIHNRPIATPCDDSVTMVVEGRLRVLRRARGFVPEGFTTTDTTTETGPILALGSENKNTFAIADGGVVYPGPHIGDLVNLSSYRHFIGSIKRYRDFLRIQPALLALDRHPDYTNRDFARLHPKLPVVEVQHHHAHLAAVLTEFGERGTAIGLIMDGSGYGEDGTIWGGEVLIGDTAESRRVGCFRPFPLPGGEMAIREPWRAALGLLYSVYGPFALNLACPFTRQIDRTTAGASIEAVTADINCPQTSSLGRLFDSVAALCGLKHQVSFEGQAAMALENELHRPARGRAGRSYDLPIRLRDDGLLILDSSNLVRRLVADLNRDRPLPEISLKFHRGVVNALLRLARKLKMETGINLVVLAGGCFQNAFLLANLERKLTADGFRVRSPERIPAGDGGLSIGQAGAALAIAANTNSKNSSATSGGGLPSK